MNITGIVMPYSVSCRMEIGKRQCRFFIKKMNEWPREGRRNVVAAGRFQPTQLESIGEAYVH